jgi:signal transduction histidine kinase/CheY-like chemotaxis protein
MNQPILSVTIQREHDTVGARQRARQIARLLGFDSQDQTRISTSVSEIARNAFNYAGGGKVEFQLEGQTRPQLFIIKISDTGPGIRDLDTILEGRYQSQTGMGLGIVGTRRLMDQFQVETLAGKGTTIWLKKLLPKRAPFAGPPDLARIAMALAQETPQSPLQELQHQNQELLNALEEIRTRQTELTRVNRELEDTNRGVVALYAELDEKADYLRRADELKTKFLSNMSHEFRSPLNSILALSGLLLGRGDGDLTADQDQQVGYIKRAAHDLLDLVNDLLDTAKVEAGKVEVKPIYFEVANLFAALRGMLRPLLINQSVTFVFDDVLDIPELFSDEGKISQILRNFISNALKFTERGEVRVSAQMIGTDEVSFSVSDTGLGIAPEHQELVFKEFMQVDSPIQRRVKGTGLGLPLSKKLAQLLGGDVGVKSELGRGSTFTVRIPIKYRDQEKDQVVASTNVLPDPSRIPVLFVEDSPETVAVYRSYLKESEFQIFTAGTTRDAERILETIQPRAIVLDIMLRSEDSWSFLAQLKKAVHTRAIPVLIASSIEDQAKGYHLGTERYLIKPISRTDLLTTLKSLTQGPAPVEVLLIDDEERDRYILKQTLKAAGVSFSESDSAEEGLDVAARLLPDIIFLDLTMPGMKGAEALVKLKGDPTTADIPVVIVTSHVLSATERGTLMERAFEVFNKGDFVTADIVGVLGRAVPRLAGGAKAG